MASPLASTVADVCYIRNQETKEKITPQGNPPKFGYKMQSQWNRLTPAGWTGEVMQFNHLKNLKTPPIEFEWHGGSPEERMDIQTQRNLFESWLIPRKATTISGGAPPRLLFVYPKRASFEAQATDYEITDEEFHPDDGMCSWCKIKISFEENRITRLTPEEVRATGLLRGVG